MIGDSTDEHEKNLSNDCPCGDCPCGDHMKEKCPGPENCPVAFGTELEEEI